MRHRRSLGATVTWSLLFNTIALPPPADQAWQELAFPKIPKRTKYEVVSSDIGAAFKATADCSAAAMYVTGAAVDLNATPVLRWKWKVEQGLDIADEKSKEGDDFAARVYVMFRFDAENASWWQRVQHMLATRIYGEVVPGNAVNYVWASRVEIGETWKNPYTDAAQMIVKQSGPVDGWQDASADIAADYRASFGKEPPPVLSVAIMTDADNTCARAVAYAGGFTFSTAR